MSKRSRPQPISAPAPESFLPTFDFGGPAPKPKSSAPLPPRKPAVVPLSKRLAAFTFLNLEDIAEEMDDHRTSPVDRISPPPSTTSIKSTRFWEFNRSKQQATTPVTPASLPPMSSKAYATLIGGSATPSSTKSSTFTPPPSKVIREAAPSSVKSPSRGGQAQKAPLQSVQEQENPKTLAVDLVSIFSVSQTDDAETSPYSKTRFSFPMPPSSIPRRGSQSPLDPEMTMSSYYASSPMTSPSSDYSFFSPLFSAGFTHQKESSSEEAGPISPLEKPKSKTTTTRGKKRHSIRTSASSPPAAPPPRESPPPTPTSPSFSTQVAAAKRACPSPELDPELSVTESSAESIISVLMGSSNESSLSLQSSSLSIGDAGEESDAESMVSAVSVLGPMHSHPQPPSQVQASRKRSAVDPVDVWENWGFGAPSRSDSIVTLTQRAYNSAIRGSISTASSPPLPTAVARSGSVGLGSTTGRNGSFGSSDVYGDWDQAIDDLFSFSAISRKPSFASIAYAATAEGAASVSTTMGVVESTAFVMDDEMMRKFTESRYLVPTRDAPTPPKHHSTLGGDSSETEGSMSNLSLDQTASSATPSASATSSARSSLDEERSTHSHHVPLTPVHDSEVPVDSLPAVAPLSLSKGTRPRPVPIVASQSYPPVNPVRPPRAPRLTSNGKVLTAAQIPEPVAISPLDLTHRPPPTQSVPSESFSLSPSVSALSLSPQSPQSLYPQSAFTTALDIDSWPTWSSIDVSFERKRDWRRPSAGAMTMVSKFSDDTVDARPASKKRRYGVAKTIKKSPQAQAVAAQNMNPGSSHTSYTFLGLKKKKENSPPRGTTAALPRESVDSARSGSSAVEGSVNRRDGLKRPPLPLELFIRA